MTRAIKHEVDRFINDLQAQYFPYNKEQWVQLGVRPIQLWELVMPKDSLPAVQKMIFGVNPTYDLKGNAKLTAMRKMLGAQKVPKFDEKLPTRIIYKDNLGVYPIGIKEDEFNKEGNENL